MLECEKYGSYDCWSKCLDGNIILNGKLLMCSYFQQNEERTFRDRNSFNPVPRLGSRSLEVDHEASLSEETNV